MSEIVGNMETADPLDTSPKAECKVVLNTKRKIGRASFLVISIIFNNINIGN